MRFLPVVGRYTGIVGPVDKEIGAPFGGIEETLVPRKAEGGAKPVDRPGLSAGPTRIVAPALMGRLAEELTAIEIEDALVRRTAVAAHEIAPCRQAVFGHIGEQPRVARFLRGVKDDPDIHHDVDKATLGSNKRA